MRHRFLSILLTLALPAAGGLHAQTDEQTRDHERQDRLYQERLRRAQAAAEQAAARGAANDAEAFLARADELARGKNYDAFRTEHYRVQTDDPDLDAAAVARLLESFHGAFGDAFGGVLTLEPDAEQSRVFLYASFYKYNQLLGADFRFQSVRPKGHYIAAFNALVLHTTSEGGPQELPDAIVHEAAHQLVARRLFAGDVPPTIWLNEGLAGYFGFMYRDERGRFQPGEVGGKSARLYHQPVKGKPRQARLRLEAVKAAFKRAEKEGTPLVATVLRREDADAFYGGEIDANYGVSWVLVHALLHGADGRHSAAFAGYVERERAGAGGADELLAALQMSESELDLYVRAHLKSIDPR